VISAKASKIIFLISTLYNPVVQTPKTVQERLSSHSDSTRSGLFPQSSRKLGVSTYGQTNRNNAIKLSEPEIAPKTPGRIPLLINLG
jgi:hypothetical protein